ncbi:unnamed protein product [Somion occarium]|uniref:Uncharacterized protein n=1 Tax=Somion occarium TaxID=3059160 RepID=A0ABP1DA49_9APHY
MPTMPSEHSPPATHDQSQSEHTQSQIKYCSSCHSSLANDSPTPFLIQPGQDATDTTAFLCPVCGSCSVSPQTRDDLFAEGERNLLRWAASLHDGGNEANARHSSSLREDDHSSHDSCPDEEMDVEASVSHPALSSRPVTRCARTYTPSSEPPSNVTHSSGPTHVPLSIVISQVVAPHESRSSPVHVSSPLPSSPFASTSKHRARQSSPPDPLLDITRLRVRSQGHHCLYPGATFQGTQKSGRNSYDVNVTIVDVDFSSSHLCGYLRIRGLTDDWPELTTYFDAEIIGSRYGFLTRNWGASEQEDMVHWGRFPAFRHIRPELKKPHLTMSDADRGAVFMRWKEKFLVPDHRVQDINGVSASPSPFFSRRRHSVAIAIAITKIGET